MQRGFMMQFDDTFSLRGHLLVAMPGMSDPRFARSVILICSHSADGAMGFVLNREIATPHFEDILEELGMDDESSLYEDQPRKVDVYQGGPVEKGRGFVLHSLDFGVAGTTKIADFCAMTATLEALRAVAGLSPPDHALMMLGYSGWGAGQLEQEIVDNGWLTVEATQQLLFETPTDGQYDAALALLGVDESALSATSGRA